MYKFTRIEIISRERETVRDRADYILKIFMTLCMCVCACLVLCNNICILPVSFALLPLSIIVFVLFPSFPFAVMGYLLIFLRCLCVNSFFSLGCEGYIKRQPTSNNVTSASIILPVTCCGMGHENAFTNTQG